MRDLLNESGIEKYKSLRYSTDYDLEKTEFDASDAFAVRFDTREFGDRTFAKIRALGTIGGHGGIESSAMPIEQAQKIYKEIQDFIKKKLQK